MDGTEKREIAVGIVRGAVGAIPFAGGMLNEVLFDIRGRIKQQRFTEFVDELSVRLNTLEENAIDENLIRSEEFGDILENILKEITKKKMHQNLSILAAITVSSMEDARVLENPLVNTFIDAIADLTPAELAVIQKLRPFNKANQEKVLKGEKELEFKLDYTNANVMGLDKTLFRATFDSLLSKGIVIDDTIGRWGGGQRDFIKPSQFGVELFKFLDEIESKS